MTQPTTIGIERLTPKICKITFSNPPANWISPRPSLGFRAAVRRQLCP
jgi:hypothetical protein